MKKICFRVLIAIILAAAIGSQFAPKSESPHPFKGIPLNGKEFSGRDVDLTAEETKNLDGALAAARIYRFNSHFYFITVINGESNRHAVHDPSFCYRGQGSMVESLKPIKFSGGTADCYQVENAKGEKMELAHWFISESTRFSSFVSYRLRSGIRRATFGQFHEEPLLVIVKALPISPVSDSELQPSPWTNSFTEWIENDLGL